MKNNEDLHKVEEAEEVNASQEEKLEDFLEDEEKAMKEEEEENQVEEDEEDEEDDDDDDDDDDIDDPLFREFDRLFGQQVLIITESTQLNLLGQTFRPIFCGPIVEVELGHITLYPVTIKILNAPFFQFPTPLSIPLEKIAHFTPNFNCEERIPLI